MQRIRTGLAGLTTASLLLAGCSMAPAYRPPVIAAPAQYKEMPGWSAATPMDSAARGAWWSLYRDPVLDDLEARLERASPTLASALARYDQARAAARESAADLYPSVSVGADAQRERLSARRPLGNDTAQKYNDFSVGAALDYEIDLWGRVRNGVKAARAEADASGADLNAARLSLQASLADAYFRLRGLDAEAALLRQTVDAYGRAFDLTATRHDGGIASGVDVNRARTQLSSAKAQISQVANDRAATEHEIAALVGEVATTFALPATDGQLTTPDLPASAPSQLLERRPDVAAAERRVFAANARIGVARAAIFPSLSLGLAGGFQASNGSLFSTPSSYWALGPLSAALAVFDGGARSARVRISRAEYDEAAADYRGTVLGAFRQVEDGLASARNLATQASDQTDATAAAQRTRDLAFSRYHDGASDYLEVVIAQTTALDAERATLALQTQRMRASVALVRALGGLY
ncbi:efflux transporter outer membrane subunit [soil metagenome]